MRERPEPLQEGEILVQVGSTTMTRFGHQYQFVIAAPVDARVYARWTRREREDWAERKFLEHRDRELMEREAKPAQQPVSRGLDPFGKLADHMTKLAGLD